MSSALPDSRGLNLFTADPGFDALLELYLPGELHTHLRPHLEKLGALAGGELDELALTADRNPPQLRSRSRAGEDRQWIEKHPAYRRLEEIAFYTRFFSNNGPRSGISAIVRRCARAM